MSAPPPPPPPRETMEMEDIPRCRTMSASSVRFGNLPTNKIAPFDDDAGSENNGAGANGAATNGVVNLAMIETDANLPDTSTGALQPPSGVVHLSPSDEPVRRRLSSNVMVTKKRIRNAKASPEVTMMHIFRSFVGAGILSMPYAFSHAGILMAPIGLVVVGAVVVFSCFCLVEAASKLSRRSETVIVDYGETFQAALKVGPKWCRRKLAVHGKNIINVLICILQPGFCAPYIVFIAQNIRSITIDYVSWDSEARLVMVALIPVLIALMMIRNIKFLGYVSLTGNVVFMVGFFIILQELLRDPPPIEDLPLVVADVSKWPTFFATCIFAFEGIIPLLHLKAQMRSQKALFGCNGVLLTTFYLIVVCYFTMGFYGYLKYGVDIRDVVTKNLPSAPLYQSLNMIYSGVLLASFPLQMLPVVEIAYFDFLVKYVPKELHDESAENENKGANNNNNNKVSPSSRSVSISSKKDSTSLRPKLIYELAFRAVLVIVISTLPIALPNVGHLIEFFGATLGTTFAIVLPNLIQLCLRYEGSDWGKGKWRLWLHIVILVISAGLIVIGAWTSGKELAHAF